VLVPGWISNLELNWEEPHLAGFLRRLASMSRLILFVKRGTGLSDPIPIDAPPDLEVRMDDVRTVLDAAG
jgi:pimeloyl-ACP methyl ester carboxylesterase